MVRTILFAALVSLLGVTASNAQYTDSAPPEQSYESDEPYPGYDYELLGDPDEYRDEYYDDDRYRGGYDQPDTDVGMFVSLGSDGRWFFQASYGWVWRPYAPVAWRPYVAGRWVWTDYGWTWVSYEPFGWATYHYGSWANDPMMGWVWVPGYEWSACRVRWAYYDNTICWAPIAPAGYYYPDPWTRSGVNIWISIGASHFCDPYPARYYYHDYYYRDARYKPQYVQTVAYKSPGRNYVERHSGTSVRTSKVTFKHTSFSRDGGSKSFDRGQSTKFRSSPQQQSRRSNELTMKAPRTAQREMRSSKEMKATQDRRPTTMREAMRPQQRQSSRELKSAQRERTAPREFRSAQRERTAPREMQSAQRERKAPREFRSAQRERQAPREFRTAERSSRPQQLERKSTAPRQQMQRSVDRERAPRSFEQRAQRVTREAYRAPKNTDRQRESVVSERKSERRDVARSKGGSSKGHGKAR